MDLNIFSYPLYQTKVVSNFHDVSKFDSKKYKKEMITYHQLGYNPRVTGNHNGERNDHEIPDRDTMQLRPPDLR